LKEILCIATYSVVEKNLCPLAKVVSSLVEVASLVQASGPLDKLLILFLGVALDSIVSVVEFLLPPSKFSLTKNN
jgi:hypothetical protein